jgi:hypothetical protein
LNTFSCTQCRHPVFFENVTCENCSSALGFVPGERAMMAFEVNAEEPWRVAGRESGKAYRPCRNYRVENVCNWMVPTDSTDEYCASCQLTEIIPALNKPENKNHWYRLEQAKRRLIYSLQGLHLSLRSRKEDPAHGLAFQFLEDIAGTERVMTGHDNGLITLNVAEADDARREKMRTTMHEPYRTLLGHFRHEVGHYYWDILIDGSPWFDEFRKLFGNEQINYADSLSRHYNQGTPTDWANNFISAYASAHPWEDWAETWAHYLHIVDGLDTAAQWGVNLRPNRATGASVNVASLARQADDFDALLVEQWLPLTCFLNCLNRSLGQPDAYPFTIASPVVDKLRFINRVIRGR